MRGRVLLISVALNVVLAVGCLLTWEAQRAALSAETAKTNSLVVIATNKFVPVYRKQFFSWREIESPDYQEYIANLRAIGCPEQTVRDIIIADVNALYARKRVTEIPDPYEQWWRTESDAVFAKTIAQKIKALDDERKLLLARLLGPDWNRNQEAARPRDYLRLDGEVLGSLSPEAKRAVQGIVDQSQRVVASLRAGGKIVSPADMAKVEQDMRTQLAGVLTPQQLEEFNLRYSVNAESLRQDLSRLKYFQTTPDEFRNLFRATDDIDLKIRLLGDSADDPAAQQQQQDLKQQREVAIKNALGPDRYNAYVQLQDPAYRAATAEATNSAGFSSSQTAGLIYQINEETAVAQALVQLDPNLTESQRALELLKIQLEQAKAQTEARGDALPPDMVPPPPPPTTIVPTAHFTSSGETLDSLAQQNGVNAAAIQAANPGVDLNAIVPGQVINIPTVEPLPPAPGPTTTIVPTPHFISSGETLNSLAQQNNISAADIQAANPGANLNNLTPGQFIIIPKSAPVTTTPAQ